jgi:hypothetical protein
MRQRRIGISPVHVEAKEAGLAQMVRMGTPFKK